MDGMVGKYINAHGCQAPRKLKKSKKVKKLKSFGNQR
jgi:hypothetical protein